MIHHRPYQPKTCVVRLSTGAGTQPGRNCAALSEGVRRLHPAPCSSRGTCAGAVGEATAKGSSLERPGDSSQPRTGHRTIGRSGVTRRRGVALVDLSGGCPIPSATPRSVSPLSLFPGLFQFHASAMQLRLVSLPVHAQILQHLSAGIKASVSTSTSAGAEGPFQSDAYRCLRCLAILHGAGRLFGCGRTARVDIVSTKKLTKQTISSSPAILTAPHRLLSGSAEPNPPPPPLARSAPSRYNRRSWDPKAVPNL